MLLCTQWIESVSTAHVRGMLHDVCGTRNCLVDESVDVFPGEKGKQPFMVLADADVDAHTRTLSFVSCGLVCEGGESSRDAL